MQAKAAPTVADSKYEEKGSFSIKLAAFQASGGAYMKLRMRFRLAGTVNRLNVEHRTSNIER
jgi:hypothetical protein